MPIRQIETRRPRRKGQYLRTAFFGPQSSGKTWTALAFATHLCNREGLNPAESIVFVDTEREGPETMSSELYAETFDFTLAPWEPPYDPRDLGDQIEHFSRTFFVVVVDSASHFWQDRGGTLNIADTASARFGGNKAAGWSEATPAQWHLTDKIHRAHSHLILCMRSGNEWNSTLTDIVGTKPIQKDGIDYDFTVAISMTRPDNSAIIHKHRISEGPHQLRIGAVYETGDQEGLWDRLYDWAQAAESTETVCTSEQVAEIRTVFELLPKGQARNTAKHSWAAKYGDPSSLARHLFDEALAMAEALVMPEPEPEPEQIKPREEAEAEALIEQMKNTKPEPPAKKPAKKTAKKPTAKKTAKKATRAAKKPAEPAADDPSPKTAGNNGDAQNGDTGLSEAEAEAHRAEMTRVFLAMDPEDADAVQDELESAGYWPIEDLAAEDVRAAVLLMAPIAETAVAAGRGPKRVDA